MKTADILAGASGKRIAVCGDVMLDQFYVCSKADMSEKQLHASDEEVFESSSEFVSCGGAAKVAVALAGLGAAVTCVGVVGDDDRGVDLRKAIDAAGARPALAIDKDRPTTLKLRVIVDADVGGRSRFRVDREARGPASSQVLAQLCDSARAAVEAADAVVIEDLEKGTMSEEFVRYLGGLVQAQSIPLFVDPKYRWTKYADLPIAAILPNLREFNLGCLSQTSGLDRPIGKAEREQAMERWPGIRAWVVTSGTGNTEVWYRDPNEDYVGNPFSIPALVTNVRPERRVGCGSAFTAAFAAASLAGRDVDVVAAAQFATLAAGAQAELPDLGAIIGARDVRGLCPKASPRERFVAGRQGRALSLLRALGQELRVREVLPGFADDPSGVLRQAAERLRCFLQTPHETYILLCGPSGSGKTSLARAAVVAHGGETSEMNFPEAVRQGRVGSQLGEWCQSGMAVLVCDELLAAEDAFRSMSGSLPTEGLLAIGPKAISLAGRKLIATGSAESADQISRDVVTRFRDRILFLPNPKEPQDMLPVLAVAMLNAAGVDALRVDCRVLLAALLRGLDQGTSRRDLAAWAQALIRHADPSVVAPAAWNSAGLGSGWLERADRLGQHLPEILVRRASSAA